MSVPAPIRDVNMGKTLRVESLSAALVALSALVACSAGTPPVIDSGTDLGTDAGADLGSDAGPRCVSSGDYRSCQCPGGAGPAVTLGCAVYPSDDTCYTYVTTCLDDGFLSCTTTNFAAHMLLEARCRAYCATDGGVPIDTPCTGW